MLPAVRSVVELCRRRGFLFAQQVADRLLIPTYGPLGTAMRRTLAAEWWQSVVGVNSNVFGLESIIYPNGLTNYPVTQLRSDLMSGILRVLPQISQSEDGYHLPFGVAQIDKVFRLEELLGPFSLCEMDAMTLVYFCSREHAGRILSHWERTRLQWWKQYGYNKGLFSVVDTSCDEVHPMPVKQRAIMYSFPWGEDEIEQIVHLDHTSLEQLQPDIKIALGSDAVPHCIHVTSTIEKAFLTILFDGYQETQRFTKDGSLIQQKVCYFHPRLAPFKVAVLPAVSDIAEFCKLADKLTDELRHAGLAAVCDKEDDLEDRFIRQDEIGTPFCVIIDEKTVKKGLCQLRSRDTTQAELLDFSDVRITLQYYLKANAKQ